jgi:DNA-binding MltR family transcriptional regulator
MDDKTDDKSQKSYWFTLLQTEFAKESDRASVILAVAMLDQALESLLRCHLVAIPNSDDSMLDGAYAPISTFSARIDLSFRLGLISSRFSRDLHIVRRIRNEFAHNVTGCSFEDSSARNRVSELLRTSRVVEMHQKYRHLYAEGTRGDFQTVVSWLLWALWYKHDDAKPLAEHSPEFGYEVNNPPTTTLPSDAANGAPLR